MDTILQTITQSDLKDNPQHTQQQALAALEDGHVLFLPEHCPTIDRKQRILLEPDILDGKHKNLSFDMRRNRLGGMNTKLKKSTTESFLHDFMNQYAVYAHQLIGEALPFYQKGIFPGRFHD